MRESFFANNFFYLLGWHPSWGERTAGADLSSADVRGRIRSGGIAGFPNLLASVVKDVPSTYRELAASRRSWKCGDIERAGRVHSQIGDSLESGSWFTTGTSPAAYVRRSAGMRWGVEPSASRRGQNRAGSKGVLDFHMPQRTVSSFRARVCRALEGVMP